MSGVGVTYGFNWWTRKDRKGGQAMYIDPFWAGVAATILAEIAFTVIAMVIFAFGGKKK